jgi:hypothetical protein
LISIKKLVGQGFGVLKGPIESILILAEKFIGGKPVLLERIAIFIEFSFF